MEVRARVRCLNLKGKVILGPARVTVLLRIFTLVTQVTVIPQQPIAIGFITPFPTVIENFCTDDHSKTKSKTESPMIWLPTPMENFIVFCSMDKSSPSKEPRQIICRASVDLNFQEQFCSSSV